MSPYVLPRLKDRDKSRSSTFDALPMGRRRTAPSEAGPDPFHKGVTLSRVTSVAFDPKNLYANFELAVTSIEDLQEALETLYERRLCAAGTTWVYRGVSNADHGFLSSLARRVWWTTAVKAGKSWTAVNPPDEKAVASAEHDILAAAHRWGIHDGDRGRL